MGARLRVASLLPLAGLSAACPPSPETAATQMAPPPAVPHIGGGDIRISGCERIWPSEDGWSCANPDPGAVAWVRIRGDLILEVEHDEERKIVESKELAEWGRVPLPAQGRVVLRLMPEGQVATIDIQALARARPIEGCSPEATGAEWVTFARRLYRSGFRSDCANSEDWLARAEAMFEAGCRRDEAARSRLARLYRALIDGRFGAALPIAVRDEEPYVDVDADIALLRLRMMTFRENGRVDEAARLIGEIESRLPFSTDAAGVAYALNEILNVADLLDLRDRLLPLRRRLEALLHQLDTGTAALTHLNLGWSYFRQAERCREKGTCSSGAAAKRSMEHSLAAHVSGALVSQDAGEVLLNLCLVARLVGDAALYEKMWRKLVRKDAPTRNPDWLRWLSLDRASRSKARPRRLEQLAETTEVPNLALRILQELVEHADPAEAIRLLQKTESLTRRWIAAQAPSAARFDLRKRYDRTQSDLVERLVAAERIDEAFVEARRARRIVLERQLATTPLESEPSTHSCSPARLDALLRAPLPASKPSPPLVRRKFSIGTDPPSPPPSNGLLLISRGLRHRHAFLRIGNVTHHARLPIESVELHPAQIAIRRFSGALDAAAALLILTSPETARSGSFHELPDPRNPKQRLGDRLLIGHKLDVVTSTSALPQRGPAVLFVDGFSEELGRSDTHLQQVRARLGGQESVLTLRRARVAELTTLLDGAGYFHFFGHADTLRDERGLRIGPGEHLSTLDIVRGDWVAPRRAVLLGCGTGAAERLAAGAALGPAQALVLRGAEAVVATRRPIDEALAQAFSRCLYSEEPASDPLQWFARARRRCTGLASALEEFVVVVP